MWVFWGVFSFSPRRWATIGAAESLPALGEHFDIKTTCARARSHGRRLGIVAVLDEG
jgi:hypothetical protein